MTVQAFFKPAGQPLHLLVRVPLKAMRDVDFPSAAPAIWICHESITLLPECADPVAIANFIEVYEGDARLPGPELAAAHLSLRVRSDRLQLLRSRRSHIFTGPKLPDSKQRCLGSAAARRAVRISDSLRSIQLFDSSWAWRGWACAWSLSSASCRLAARCAHSNSTAIPGLVRLDPRWYQAGLAIRRDSASSTSSDGTDHLLFLFCLVIPFRRLRSLIPIVTRSPWRTPLP